jgi:sterol desaturase/sphingolipid hydroxylase (fatty acid hydroxylase superfamily)
MMRKVHGQHHYRLNHLAATSASRASYFEFMTLELLGSFLLGPMCIRMHWITVLAIWLYTACGAAVDHSGFRVNAWIDGSHHYLHHIRGNTDYSEVEIFDTFFKTQSVVPD